MHLTQPPLSWLILSLPLAFVLVGLFVSYRRWRRVNRHPDQDPGTLLLGAVSQSLQERGRLAASLGELRTVHERLLDALPFGILWVDQKGQVAAVNAQGRAILGVKAGVVGLDAAFVLEPFPWILAGLNEDPGPSWRADGGGRRWQLRRIQVPDIVGSLLQFEDITELEAEERRQQLRDRFAELGEMTAGVAHQLKNGLAVLKGHGQLLEKAGHAETAGDLLEEVQSLERLAQRFLLWAKPLEPRLAPLRLEEVASQAAMEVHRRPAFQDRVLTVEGEGAAVGDPMLLHQALVNLLENACQATPRGRRVKVVAAPGLLTVLDEGPGFQPESLAKMLRPFESGSPDGTGLGLPLALKWLNAMGAEMIFSLRPEGGTRVDIRL
ncbi:MAG TPA: ATP-binding protein [Holophaga sp.]|nr:ATP-binding protein [Holophaga sp.]